MFEKLKWKLKGKLKVKKNKLKNEATYIFEFAPDDYETVIKHFPLINNVILTNLSNENEFSEIESGQYGVDILKFKIFEGRTKALRTLDFITALLKMLKTLK